MSSRNASDLLPDALAEAIARQLSKAQASWAKDLENMKAQSGMLVAELRAEISELKARLKDAADAEISRLREAVALVKDGAPGNDGAPGRDGVEGAPGRDGVDGKDGIDGKDGTDGRDGAPGKDGEPGRHGKDGAPGEPGVPGKDGMHGKDGAPGKDGVGVAGAVINREGVLTLTLTDGTTRELGRIVGKDGENGAPGLGFEDMTEELSDDGRTVIRRYKRGDQVKEFLHKFSVPIYRDVFKDGTSYEAGDMVTFGGSVWVARNDTSSKPGDGDAWKLAVKRGRDGKDTRP